MWIARGHRNSRVTCFKSYADIALGLRDVKKKKDFSLADRFILSHIPVVLVQETGGANGAEYSSDNLVRIARGPEQRPKHILHCSGWADSNKDS